MSVDRSAGCICWIAWSGVNGMSSQTCSLHLCVTLSSLRTTHPLVFLVVHTGLRVRARHENFRHAMILRRTFTDAVLGTLISPPRWARSYLRRATSHCCCSFFCFLPVLRRYRRTSSVSRSEALRPVMSTVLTGTAPQAIIDDLDSVEHDV